MSGEAHRAVERAMIVRFLRRLSKQSRKEGDLVGRMSADILHAAANEIEANHHVEKQKRKKRHAGELLRTANVPMGPRGHDERE